jgi:CHAT domain
MSRTIVRIQESTDGATTGFWLESPRTYAGATLISPLTCRPDESPFCEMHNGDGSPNWVRDAGETLFHELSKHPAVQPAIAAALTQIVGGCSPICFRLDDVTIADDLPWEAVRFNDFFALDQRWPIVRMRDATEANTRLIYTLEPPLRITIVLSAAGRSPENRAPGAPQWQRIHDTIEKHLAENDAIPVSVTVFSGERALLEAIGNPKKPWVQAYLIADKSGLLEQIRKSRPHILHFFCHGISDQTPHLSVGSYADWEGELDPSIAITAPELRQKADPDQNIWLVTLNCCESATRAGNVRGFASSLVAAGFPAAVGMREVVEVEHAHLLCKSFYPEVMRMIGAVPEGGPESDIEWAKALWQARIDLAENGANGVPAQSAGRGSKVWTIPALYVRREAFLLKRIAPSPPAQIGLSLAKKKIIEYIQTLQQQRAKAAEDYKDLPPAALNAILSDLDNQIALKTAELSKA